MSERKRPAGVPDDMPIYDSFEQLAEAMDAADAGTLGDRNRPYDGQAHTDDGERGKTLVAGLTMRDVADCFALGFFQAASHEAPELYQLSEVGQVTRGDLYKIPDLNKLDPGAVIQNAMCQIEKRMGIYPNLPGRAGVPGE